MGVVPDDDGDQRFAVLFGGVEACSDLVNPFSQWRCLGGIPRSLQLVWWASQWSVTDVFFESSAPVVVHDTGANGVGGTNGTSSGTGGTVPTGGSAVALNDDGRRVDALSCALGALACLLRSSASFREDMAQIRGLVLLQHILRQARRGALTTAVVDAAFECAIACRPFRHLFITAARSVLCDFRIWCRGPWSSQFHVRVVVCFVCLRACMCVSMCVGVGMSRCVQAWWQLSHSVTDLTMGSCLACGMVVWDVSCLTHGAGFLHV